MVKFLLTCIAIFVISLSNAQTWLDQANQQQNMTRIGFGLQAMEPTSIIFQLYKGGFCSNDNTYANYFTLEAVAGLENSLVKSSKSYKTGTWRDGVFQTGVNIYYPLYTLPAPSFSAQVHVGAGLQGGNRKYEEQGQS